MKRRNVWKGLRPPLFLVKDVRGRIADIFYKARIAHVAIIASKKGARRGDHYHKRSTQHILITKGSLEYWYKPLGGRGKARCVVLRVGDMVTTPPNEIHALRILSANEFVVFTEGRRGGRDYESDTFRVRPSLIPPPKARG